MSASESAPFVPLVLVAVCWYFPVRTQWRHSSGVPQLSYDPLADIVRSLDLSGGVFLEARLCAPWAIASRVTPADCQRLVSEPGEIIAYHVVTKGRLLVEIEGLPALEAVAGDIILLPRNDFHVLMSEPGLPLQYGDELAAMPEEGGLARIDIDAAGDPTHIVCGFLATVAGTNPLFRALPRLLTLPIGDIATLGWVEASMRFAAQELARGSIGSTTVVSKISELLLVEALRRVGETGETASAGVLRALADARLGKALAMLHKEPQRQWSIDELAHCVAMSKSAFIERFSKLVGIPPIRYLTTLRMANAKELLRETNHSTAEIAHMAGFESSVAFNRAFKRATGLPPAAWRHAEGKRETG